MVIPATKLLPVKLKQQTTTEEQNTIKLLYSIKMGKCCSCFRKNNNFHLGGSTLNNAHDIEGDEFNGIYAIADADATNYLKISSYLENPITYPFNQTDEQQYPLRIDPNELKILPPDLAYQQQALVPTRNASPYASGPLETVNASSQSWTCSICQFVNHSLMPYCEKCTMGSSLYQYETETRIELRNSPPPDRNPNLQNINQDEVRNERLTFENENQIDSRQLYEVLDDVPVLINEEPFDCTICLTKIEKGQGVRLHQCLHQFCIPCLKNYFQATETPAKPCPFRGEDYACKEIIEDREIREILDPEAYERHLALSVRNAEAAAGDNAFHCRRPDCKGWWLLDAMGLLDGQNQVSCPVCNTPNCMQCRAIHQGQNCREFQDDILLRANNDQTAQATQEALAAMLRSGEAMLCSTCGVTVAKTEGCDAIECSVCHTELCWATKGPRWGPGGRGDTTGGCKCGVNGDRCTPTCANCH